MTINTNTRIRWEVLKHFPELKDMTGRRVLDVGAGLGFFSMQFAELGADVVAVDIDQASLDFISRNYGFVTKRMDVEVDDLDEKQYDLIFIGEVLEHVADPMSLLTKMERSLKHSGHMVLSTPAMEGPLIHSKGKSLCHSHGAEKHARDGFYYGELESCFNRLGMNLVRHSYCIYLLAELFMQLTKLGYSLKKKEYSSQSDVLTSTSSLPYRMLKAVFPAFMMIFMGEQKFCEALSLKGHCHIVMAQKGG